MKKTKILFLTLAITTLGMVTLSGCSKNAAHAAKQIPSASPTTDTTVSAQAYENGEELSADEQMQEENIRREEVAKQYSIYEPYGMTYDKNISVGNGRHCRGFRGVHVKVRTKDVNY